MPPFNVLFLCNHNSARSILAEAILIKQGGGRFRAFSAGSTPRGDVNPDTLSYLIATGHDVGFARSKSWDEFCASGSPEMDFVITVCDDAAAEVCPIWPGQPVSANWGVPDPSKTSGSDAEVHASFDTAYRRLEKRIGMMLALDIEAMDTGEIEKRMSEIGQMPV